MPKEYPFRLIILKEVPTRNTLNVLYYKTLLELKNDYDLLSQEYTSTKNYKFIIEEFMELECEWVDIKNLIK